MDSGVQSGQRHEEAAALLEQPAAWHSKEFALVHDDSTPTTTDPRPMRDYPCPHCGGEGRIAEDYLDAWTPITRPCGYCEGRGHFTRPVLPRGAVRAFKVSWWERENVDDWYERARLVHAASPAKAKMVVAREMVQDWITVGGEQMAIDPVFDSIGEALRELSVRRAPEHDSSLDGATSERSA